ncbi:MAG: RNA methyltransferase [Muribaculaceae bacterium]|nr:RNA methyltransferase [Muribaculaceae bacterium]
MNENFEMVAKTFQGLEGVLADELRALGAQDVMQGVRMVSFMGDKELLYKANFCCRTALRILKPFYKFKSSSADDLYEQVKTYDWSTILNVDSTFAIDSTTHGEEFRHSRFVTYRVKDAIADFFMERDGKRPSIRVTNPDIHIDVHINGNEVTLSLDSSGEPLYRRGWRKGQGEAPINEVLAAGIIKLAGWDGQTDLVDPMCGSGTFLVEAALIAANINPGVFRQHYAFQQWDDYDADLFSSIYNDDSGEREFQHKIYGSDIDAKSVAIARANVKSAGVARMVELEMRDLADIQEVPEHGTLITNPPYDVRLRADESLYSLLGQKLKFVFKGYHAWVIANDGELFDQIALKPSVKYPLVNGSIECELREYVIFDGKYNEMRGRGESIRNHDFQNRATERGGERPRFRETFGEHPRRDADRPARFRREDGERPRRDDDRPARFRREDGERPRRDGDRPTRFRREDGERPRRDGDRPARFRREDGDERGRSRSPRTQSFHGPRLGADKEVPIIHGRRKSWKRRDLDE